MLSFIMIVNPAGVVTGISQEVKAETTQEYVEPLAEIVDEAKEEEQSLSSTEEKELIYYDDEVAFDADYKVTSQWENHCNAEVTIKNTGFEKVDNWQIAFTYTGEIEQIWNAQIVSHEGDVYVIKNVKWNQDIAPNASVGFGFRVKYDKMPEKPKDFNIQKMEEEVVEDGYEFKYTEFARWGNELQGQIEITNLSDNYIEDWRLMFDTNVKIKQMWKAHVTDECENYASDLLEDDDIMEEEGTEEETDEIFDEEVVGYNYNLYNEGYNENIAPGETINFGFIAESVDGQETQFDNAELSQLTATPEEDEEDEYIEGESEEMEEITNHELEEEDYYQMLEFKEEEKVSAMSITALSDSNEIQETGNIAEISSTNEATETNETTEATKTNMCASDSIPYEVKNLPHRKQIQAWYQYKTSKNNLMFVVQNEANGTAIISLCKFDSSINAYNYESEIRVKNAGHVQTIYCDSHVKSGEKDNYYLLINCCGVKYTSDGTNSVWSTSIGRVAFDRSAEASDVSKKSLKKEYDNGKIGNCLKLVDSSKLRQFSSVAYSNKTNTAFAGVNDDKKAELKRVEFGVSLQDTKSKRYLAIVKKSGICKTDKNKDNNTEKIEYSLYNLQKLVNKLKKSKTKKVSFNNSKIKKLCKASSKEKQGSELYKRKSIQGVAVDSKGNIFITSGDDKLHTDKDPRNIGIFYKARAKDSKGNYTKKYGKKIKFTSLEYDIKNDLWMKNEIAKLVVVDEREGKNTKIKAEDIPKLEIEGAQIMDGKIYYAVGTEAKSYDVVVSENKTEKRFWRNRGFIFVRDLDDVK